MSAATSSGRFFCFSSQRANLPTVVVLPEPCRPTIMIAVGPFLAQSIVRSIGPISSISFSWQMRMKCCSGVADSARSPALARSLTAVPSASSFTRSRKVLVTLNSTSASSSDMRTSRSASSILSSVSSATPVNRAFALRKPRERVSSMRGEIPRRPTTDKPAMVERYLFSAASLTRSILPSDSVSPLASASPDAVALTRKRFPTSTVTSEEPPLCHCSQPGAPPMSTARA